MNSNGIFSEFLREELAKRNALKTAQQKSQLCDLLKAAVREISHKKYMEAAEIYKFIFTFLHNVDCANEVCFQRIHTYGIKISMCYSTMKTPTPYQFVENMLAEMNQETETSISRYLEIVYNFVTGSYAQVIYCIEKFIKTKFKVPIPSIAFNGIKILDEDIIPELNNNLMYKNLEIFGLCSFLWERESKANATEEFKGNASKKMLNKFIHELLNSISIGLDKTNTDYFDIRKKYQSRKTILLDIYAKISKKDKKLFQNILRMNSNILRELEMMLPLGNTKSTENIVESLQNEELKVHEIETEKKELKKNGTQVADVTKTNQTTTTKTNKKKKKKKHNNASESSEVDNAEKLKNNTQQVRSEIKSDEKGNETDENQSSTKKSSKTITSKCEIEFRTLESFGKGNVGEESTKVLMIQGSVDEDDCNEINKLLSSKLLHNLISSSSSDSNTKEKEASSASKAETTKASAKETENKIQKEISKQTDVSNKILKEIQSVKDIVKKTNEKDKELSELRKEVAELKKKLLKESSKRCHENDLKQQILNLENENSTLKEQVASQKEVRERESIVITQLHGIIRDLVIDRCSQQILIYTKYTSEAQKLVNFYLDVESFLNITTTPSRGEWEAELQLLKKEATKIKEAHSQFEGYCENIRANYNVELLRRWPRLPDPIQHDNLYRNFRKSLLPVMEIPFHNNGSIAVGSSNRSYAGKCQKNPTDKIFEYLLKHTSSTDENVILTALGNVIEGNGGSLEGLSEKDILNQVQTVIELDTSCTICFELFSISPQHKLPCNHKFHKKCIKTWLKNSKCCPICREPCPQEQEQPVPAWNGFQALFK